MLGLGQPWQGFIWANSLLMERLRQCDPEEMVLVLDGYDTLITMPADEMLVAYSKVCADATERAGGRAPTSPPGKWLVFGIEHPREACSVAYWHTAVRHFRRYHLVPPRSELYINTGAMLGPALHALTYMQETCKDSQIMGNKDDQNTANALYWARWVNPDHAHVSKPDAPFPLALDTSCDLFYCHCERRLAYLLFSMAYSPTNAHTLPARRTLSFTDGRIVRKVGCSTCPNRRTAHVRAKTSTHRPDARTHGYPRARAR